MSRNGKPNIVLIVLDTLTAEAAGLGRTPARMPALESLAEKGMVYTHAVSNAPWTYPSHASLFTGLLPSEHRMETPKEGLAWGKDLSRLAEWIGPIRGPANDPVLADRWLPAVLSRAGYQTATVSNNPFVGRLMGMDYGFAHRRDSVGVAFLPTRALRRVPKSARGYVQAGVMASRALRGKGDMLAKNGVARASEWMSGLDSTRPFFLFVNLMEAHYPYLTPEASRAARAASAGPITAFRAMLLLRYRRIVQFNLDADPGDHRSSLRLLHALHCHAATYLDQRMRELHELSSRQGRGLITCVTSDHGEEFGEHHALAHMFTLDEPALHIPLVMTGDGVPAGERAATVGLGQVYSTLLSAAGLAVPEGAASSLLDGPPGEVISERERIDPPAWAPTSTGRARERIGRVRAVYRDPWKLVSTTLGSRLFDLSADPGEAQDVAVDQPDLVTSMKASLPEWPEYRSEIAAGEDGSRPAGSGSPGLTEREEAEIKDQLAALGYTE